jgi:hypothetical protein
MLPVPVAKMGQMLEAILSRIHRDATWLVMCDHIVKFAPRTTGAGELFQGQSDSRVTWL